MPDIIIIIIFFIAHYINYITVILFISKPYLIKPKISYDY